MYSSGGPWSVFLWLKCVSGLEDTGAGEKHIRERHKDEDTQ